MAEEFRKRIEKEVETALEKDEVETYEIRLEERRFRKLRKIVLPEKVRIEKLSDLIINEGLKDNPSIMLFGRSQTGKSTFAYIVTREIAPSGLVVYVDSEGNLPWRLPENVIYIPKSFLPFDEVARTEFVINTIHELYNLFKKAKAVNTVETILQTLGIKMKIDYVKETKTFKCRIEDGEEFNVSKFLVIVDSLSGLVSPKRGIGKESEKAFARRELLDKVSQVVAYLYNLYRLPSAFLVIQHLRSDPMLVTKAIEDVKKLEKYRNKHVRTILDIEVQDRLFYQEPKGESIRYLLKETFFSELIDRKPDSLTFTYFTWRSRLYGIARELARITLFTDGKARIELKVKGEISIKRSLDIEYT